MFARTSAAYLSDGPELTEGDKMPMEIIEPFDRFNLGYQCPKCEMKGIEELCLCNCYPPFRWATFTDNELKGYRFVGD